MTEYKPLTKDEIAALHTECSIHQFDSWVWGRMAALIATIEQQREQIEKLRGKCEEASALIDPHLNDCDTYVAQAYNAIEEALAATEPKP